MEEAASMMTTMTMDWTALIRTMEEEDALMKEVSLMLMVDNYLTLMEVVVGVDWETWEKVEEDQL